MNVFNLISAGGGKSEGLYIWKKSESTLVSRSEKASPTGTHIYPIGTVSKDTFTVYLGTAYTFDDNGVYTLTDAEPREIIMNRRLNLLKGYYYMVDGDNKTIYENVSNETLYFQYDNTWGYLSIEGTDLAANLYKYTVKRELVFIDYVVSDKEDAYPDGGEQGGFYYEKYNVIEPSALGFSNCIKGKFVPTGTIQSVIVSVPKMNSPCIAIVKSEESAAASNIVSFQTIGINKTNEYPSANFNNNFNTAYIAQNSTPYYGDNMTNFPFYAYRQYYMDGKEYYYWIFY